MCVNALKSLFITCFFFLTCNYNCAGEVKFYELFFKHYTLTQSFKVWNIHEILRTIHVLDTNVLKILSLRGRMSTGNKFTYLLHLIPYEKIYISFNNAYLMKSIDGRITAIAPNFNQHGKILTTFGLIGRMLPNFATKIICHI